jgi:AraC-like DNA-binding protein
LLLSGTDKPIKGIAHSVGFPDENHFTRAFTQATGVSPRVYRKSQTKTAPAATGPGARTRDT